MSARQFLPWHIALAVAAFLAIALSALSNAGFCPLESRFLQDTDYFKGAIDVVIHDPVDGVVERVPGAINFKLVHSKRYLSVDEFLTAYPNCCKFVSSTFGDDLPEISLLDMLRGVRTVQVSHDKMYEEDGKQKSTAVTVKVAVTNCGKGRPYR